MSNVPLTSIHLNDSSLFASRLQSADEAFLSPRVLDDVKRHLADVPLASTQLHSLSALARTLGVASLLVKDEGTRSSLGSFKALGGGYAVIRLALAAASHALGRAVDPAQLHNHDVQRVVQSLVFACATDGNHGRAVAAGARLVGATSEIFVHAGVSADRIRAIEQEGARVTRVSGYYDDSIAALNEAAAARGWQVVSDTSWPGYEEIPSWVMQGYLVMVEEAVDQAFATCSAPPTHVFLQAGVGGFAAATAGYLRLRLGPSGPRVVVVEPDRAACLFESAKVGRAIRIAAGKPTVMAMLECYEPSMIAWRILERTAFAFMRIDESAAIDAMKMLARPAGDDAKVVAGESGGAGLAGLLRAAESAATRDLLGLDDASIVLLFNTESASDLVLYRRLVGETEIIE